MFWHPYQLYPVTFCQFCWGTDGSPGPMWNYGEIIMGLTGRLTIRKNTDVPTCIPLFCIPHYTSLNISILYISAWNIVVWSQRLKLFEPHLYIPEISASIGLTPVCVPDQTSFHLQFESILPLTYVREPDCELLVVCVSWCHPVTPPPVRWVQITCPKILCHNRNL